VWCCGYENRRWHQPTCCTFTDHSADDSGHPRLSRSSLVSEESGALRALAYRDKVRLFVKRQDTDYTLTTANLEFITVNGDVLGMYPLRFGVTLQRLYLVGCGFAGNFVGASYSVRSRQFGGYPVADAGYSCRLFINCSMNRLN